MTPFPVSPTQIHTQPASLSWVSLGAHASGKYSVGASPWKPSRVTEQSGWKMYYQPSHLKLRTYFSMEKNTMQKHSVF